MANLKKGSTGSDVKKLQETLIEKGYNVGGTGADGVLGKNTEAAIKQYQKDNGLQVDGIAGKNTLGSLYGSGTQKTNGTGNGGAAKAGNADKPATVAPAEATPVTSPGGVTYGDFTYQTFDPNTSENIQQAQTLLDQNNANRPGAWVDPYQSQYMDYLNQYENRDPFSYDFNSDALYQQYKDNYILQGQMAMMDTMGQAASMTGGYGNSYAQSVGQQAYNQYLGQLNEIIPELNQMAYDRYQQEGQDLLNMYGIYKGLSDDSYGRYQDEVDNWYREDTRLTNNYNTIYGQEWDQYSLGYDTAWSEYLTSRNEKFTTEQNEKEWERQDKETAKNDLINLITGTGYKPTDEELKAAGITRDQANSYTKAYTDSKTATSGGTGTGSNAGAKYSDLGVGTQTQWDSYAKKADTWNGLTDVWGRMKIAGHDPIGSATYIMQWAANNDGAKPTYDELLDFGDTLEKAGVSEDEIKAFIYEWQNRFGLVEKNPSLSGLLGVLPTIGANIASGVGGFLANIKNGASK